VELTLVSHMRKLRVFNKTLSKEDWFTDRIAKTGLADLATTGNMMVDPYLISAFAERWHELTASFHMSAGEVTMTLDDVSCLMHLSNVGRLPDHQYVNKGEGTKLMVDLIGADPADVANEMVVTKGSHVRHTYLMLVEDSHVLAKVREIIWLSTFYVESYQRKGGGPAATQ
jgi:hypothetical protein